MQSSTGLVEEAEQEAALVLLVAGSHSTSWSSAEPGEAVGFDAASAVLPLLLLPAPPLPSAALGASHAVLPTSLDRPSSPRAAAAMAAEKPVGYSTPIDDEEARSAPRAASIAASGPGGNGASTARGGRPGPDAAARC